MKYYRVNKKNKRKIKQTKIRNRKLIKKYPWIIPRNVWTGKIPDDYDYSYTEWELPVGWYKSFGMIYLKELGDAVEEAGLKNEFRIYQIKEKYGQLRVYANSGTDKIHRIISKYEHISENVCICCGKPDVPIITTGWISPVCFDCYENDWRKREKWNIAYDKTMIPETEEVIKKAYEEDTKGSPNVIADSYTIHRFGKDGDTKTTYDISATVNAIRQRWNKRRRK